MIPILDCATPVQALLDIADDLLREHEAVHAAAPEQPEPQLLLDTLATVRTLLKHAPRHPDLWQPLYDLADRVIAAAESARADLRALDLAPRPYLRVILAARSLQITLADNAQRAQEQAEKQVKQAPTEQPARPVSLRQPVPRHYAPRVGDDDDDEADNDDLLRGIRPHLAG